MSNSETNPQQDFGMVQDPCQYESEVNVIRREAVHVKAIMERWNFSFEEAFERYFGRNLASPRKTQREKDLIIGSKDKMKIYIDGMEKVL